MSDERRRKPGRSGEARAGDAARGILGRLDKQGNLARAKAIAAWKDAAGPEVAGHAVGAAMRDGELLIYVDSPVWASELSALSERYRVEICSRLGQELVTSVRFTLSKKVSEQHDRDEAEARLKEETRPARVEPVPATEQERAQIRAMAAPIHDETLREAAIRAAICGLEWRKGTRPRKTPQAAADGPEGAETSAEH